MLNNVEWCGTDYGCRQSNICTTKLYSGTSISRSAKGLRKLVRYIEGSLYRGSFPYITLLLGWKMSFVKPRTSLYRGSLNRGSTVFNNVGGC